ncbi:hypothetical protein D3C72_1835650 [compost metagenome]
MARRCCERISHIRSVNKIAHHGPVPPHIQRLRIERTVCKNGNHTLDSIGLLPLTVGIAQTQNPAWHAMLCLFDAQVVLNRQFGGAVGPHGHGGVGLTQRHILRPPVHRPTG